MSDFQNFPHRAFLGISLLICSLAACATHDYTLLHTDPGWIELSEPPAEEKAILAIASRQIQQEYNSRNYDYVWFGRSPGEYLIYFHDHIWTGDENYPKSHCGDETVIFQKTETGWVQTKLGKNVICVD